MSSIPEHLHYTREHEYVGDAGREDVYVIGITDFAQGELGDIVYVELPRTGERFEQMEIFGTIEAVKAVSDLYCPIAGEVVEVNEELDMSPELVNTDPYGGGWMIRLRADKENALDGLLTAGEYAACIDEEE